MTPEEQSYVDNKCDGMDPETEKVYRQYIQFKIELRAKWRSFCSKAKLWAIWFTVEVCTIPLWGYTIAQLWNWFVSLAGFNTLTWMQGYCLAFAVRMIFTNCGTNAPKTEYGQELANFIRGEPSQFDDLNISDTAIVTIMAAIYDVMPPLIALFGGWVLSCFLYA